MKKTTDIELLLVPKQITGSMYGFLICNIFNLGFRKEIGKQGETIHGNEAGVMMDHYKDSTSVTLNQFLAWETNAPYESNDAAISKCIKGVVTNSRNKLFEECL